jgi:hypothetical protein
MTQHSTERDWLQSLTEYPIGGDSCSSAEAARRANKVWLPAGKRSANSREVRATQQELRAKQIDIEDAVEAAGGERGKLNEA